MKKKMFLSLGFLMGCLLIQAQVEPGAGSWKTWLIGETKSYRLPAPVANTSEIADVVDVQKKLNAAAMQQIVFWNAGSPGYRWQEMMANLWTSGIFDKGPLANMLLGAAIYDATIAAWDTKYFYKRPRPYIADSRVKVYTAKPESPSYPCEHSVAAGAAVTIIAHFFPKMADSVNRMAAQAMASRVAAGVAFPSDTKAGFELGKKVAGRAIDQTENFVTTSQWDGKSPQQKGIWTGKNPMGIMARHFKTLVLDSGSQFRPAPPPDFEKDMEELRNFKQTFSSQSNAFYYASQFGWEDLLSKKIFENNLQLNPPRAARIYAIMGIGTYEMFVACFDAKYAYWGIRPNQYDTTYKSLVPTPPFPGYPSGHAAGSGTMAELFSYFFPADSSNFRRIAKDVAESRFQAGIHFRTDNEVGLELGRKVGNALIQRLRKDGADQITTIKSTVKH